MKNSPNSIAKTALIITIVTAVSRILGFAREAVIAYVFGVGAVTDAYAVAVRVVGTAGLLVSTYLLQIFIPIYTRALEEGGEETSLKASNNVLNFSLIINFLIAGVLYVVAPIIIGITGFDNEQASLALAATNILILQLPLMTFVHFFVGYLTARKSFFGPNFIGIPVNIVIMTLCLVFGAQGGVRGLSFAALTATIIQALILIIWLRKEGYRHKFYLRINTLEIRNGMKLLIPALLSSALLDLKTWVDTIIATYLGEGNTAAIGFALRLITLVQGLFIVPIANMIFSYMSEYAAKNDIKGMLNILWKTVRVILFFVIPIVVIAMPSGFDVTRIVYQRGEFTAEATIMTGTALVWYLPGLLGMTIYIFLVHFFHGLQNTKIPMICSAITVVINIGLSIWLSDVMGIGGLTLATSISITLTAVLLLIFLRKKIGPLGLKETAMDVVKMAICAVPCFLAVLGARYFMAEYSAIIRFAATTLAGGAAYVIVALMIKEIVVRDAVHMIRERFNK